MYIIYFKLYPELSKKKEKLNTLIQRYEFKNNFPRIGRKFRSFEKYQNPRIIVRLNIRKN